MKTPLIRLLAVSAFAAIALPAQAAGLCSTGQATEGISVTDVTYEGANASDCYGVVAGNLNPSQAESFVNDTSTQPGSVWGGGWTHVAKDENGSGSGTFQGLSFTLDASGVNSANSGTWTLTVTDTNGGAPLNLPTTLDLVTILKGGNELALWFFDDVTVDSSNEGTWRISFLNNGGNRPNLSHMDLLVRNGSNEVSEPGGLGLLGLGLAGLAALRRRRSV